MREVIWDCETDGLLPQVSKIWVISLMVIDDDVPSPIFSYIGDEIDDAVGIIEQADVSIGHNLVGYDLMVLDKLYEDFQPKEGQIVRDTQVLSQMIFANQKDKDYKLHERGTLEGKLIGRHGLEAWGQRLGHYKGSYAKDMEKLGRDPWKDFDMEMGVPYCEDDIEVTYRLWMKCKQVEWSREAIVLEHQITELMAIQEQSGIWFDVEAARILEAEVSGEYEKLEKIAVEHFGYWMAPAKKYKGEPREKYGEDDSRSIWGEVTIEKRPTRRVKLKEGPGEGKYAHFSQDAPYCKIEKKEFNPNSRPQIIDRLRVVYNWEPVDFTEAGNPTVDDEVLRELANDWPICETLAELFFLSKLLGMLSDGKNGWLKMVDELGFIHPRTNAGGTRSGRASHSSPNIAQVPKVKVMDTVFKDGTKNPALLGPDGEFLPHCFKEDGTLKKAAVVMGRAGNYGWECRNLFQAPKLNGHQWWLMGCDLSGIELRCFGHHLAQYDSGAYLEVVLNGDVHTTNQQAAGLPTRDNAKTFIYATLYGGGDAKIGSIVCPPGTPEKKMAARGKELKAKFQEGVPAYRELMRWVARQAKQGWMPGLDGRRLWVKSPHSALNLLLQSDGALIAKKWVCLYVQYMEEAGYRLGWNGDFTLCAWVHDEIQSACRTKEIAEHAKQIAIRAAADAGHHFNYRAPVGAEGKIGLTWAQTH